MKESKFYQEILEEGMKEGSLQAQRAAVREVLESRFPDKAGEFAADIAGVTSPAQLSKLLRVAVRCRRIPEFRRALASGRTDGD